MTRVIHEIKAPYKKTHDHKSGEVKHVSIIAIVLFKKLSTFGCFKCSDEWGTWE